jgi:hypothetical protein
LSVPESGHLPLPVRLAPHPFQNHLAILSEVPIEKISIRDVQGRQCKNFSVPSGNTFFETETSGLLPGLYFIHIQCGGGRIYTLKSVKIR